MWWSGNPGAIGGIRRKKLSMKKCNINNVSEMIFRFVESEDSIGEERVKRMVDTYHEATRTWEFWNLCSPSKTIRLFSPPLHAFWDHTRGNEPKLVVLWYAELSGLQLPRYESSYMEKRTDSLSSRVFNSTSITLSLLEHGRDRSPTWTSSNSSPCLQNIFPSAPRWVADTPWIVRVAFEEQS